MKKLVLGATMGAMLIGLNGCTVSNSCQLDKSFEEYKTYKSHKAMAVAMNDDGRCAIGYAYDYSSQNSANNGALKRCANSNNQSENKITAQCEIYAIDNDIVRDSN